MAYKQFDFHNTSYNLVPVLKQMLEFIGTNLPATARVEKTIFNARVILTELLTNSLKHSGSASTVMTISLSDTDLILSKTDYGIPLTLINMQKALGKIPITNDILHTLYAITEAKNKLSFICEENRMEDILIIEDIVEHFGLLIITKAADNFTYIYNDSAKSNLFRVIINY